MTEAPNAISTIKTAAGRVDQVFAWLVGGHSEADVVGAIEKYWPGTKPRPLLVAAWKKIARSGASADADSVKGFCVEATRAVYQKAMETGDYGVALRAIRQLSEFSQE
jgi:hypothetical protein